MTNPHGPLRVGVGGPVGTGKTALMDALCRTFAPRYDVAAITNDIYTKEDAEFLTRAGSLPPERILGIETGGCPHTAIREDASINLAGVADLRRRFPALDVILIESGGDNLAATFSPELADLTIYVIDVSAGDKIPRKGGPGITRSDLLVINKTDLAPHVGASLEVMDRDARAMRGARPFQFARVRDGVGVPEDVDRACQLYQAAATTTGGTTYIYSPPVGKGGSGRVIPITTPVIPGLPVARERLETLRYRVGEADRARSPCLAIGR